jgi:hypothetical protein
LIRFDKRGTGVSDPVPLAALPTLEEWMDDVRTVMDAAGSKGAALVVAPVVDGTTWETILTDVDKDKSTDVPDWAVIPGAGSDGLGEVESLLPEAVAAGNVLVMEMTRGAYYVGCHTAPEAANTPYPGALVRTMPG